MPFPQPVPSLPPVKQLTAKLVLKNFNGNSIAFLIISYYHGYDAISFGHPTFDSRCQNEKI